MKRPLYTAFLSGLLILSGWGAGSNLLTNGSLADSPNPSKDQGTEEHDHTWKAPYEVESSLPGFKVTRGKVYLVLSKRSTKRWIDLNGGGGVLQNLTLTPNRPYLLRFTLEGDPQGRDEQSVSIQGPGLNTSENVSPEGRRVITSQFTPTLNQGAVEIYATSGGRGPRIFNLSVEAQ
ncbi:MAG: hypothetical protein U0931_22330 [Vulcanimicrobiota bacterium]